MFASFLITALLNFLPAGTIDHLDTHLALSSQGSLVVVNDMGIQFNKFDWTFSPNYGSEGGEGKDQEVSASVNIDANNDLSFNASWYDCENSTSYTFNMVQHPDGRISAEMSIDALDFKLEANNFEQACLRYPGLRHLLDDRFFDGMEITNPVEQKFMDRREALKAKADDPEWIAPVGLKERIDAILPRMNDDKWKVRDAASDDLYATGLDGVVYVMHNVDRSKLTPEQNCRLDSFIHFWMYPAALNDEER